MWLEAIIVEGNGAGIRPRQSCTAWNRGAGSRREQGMDGGVGGGGRNGSEPRGARVKARAGVGLCGLGVSTVWLSERLVFFE